MSRVCKGKQGNVSSLQGKTGKCLESAWENRELSRVYRGKQGNVSSLQGKTGKCLQSAGEKCPNSTVSKMDGGCENDVNFTVFDHVNSVRSTLGEIDF